MTDHEFAELLHRLQELHPDVMDMAADAAAPVVRIDCPRGHTVIHARLDPDHNGQPVLLFVNPSGDPLSHRARPRATSGRPQAARGVCEVPGCPNLRPCATHDDTSQEIAVDVVDTRNRLQCPRCTVNGVYTRGYLLAEYVAAAAMWLRIAGMVEVRPSFTLRA